MSTVGVGSHIEINEKSTLRLASRADPKASRKTDGFVTGFYLHGAHASRDTSPSRGPNEQQRRAERRSGPRRGRGVSRHARAHATTGASGGRVASPSGRDAEAQYASSQAVVPPCPSETQASEIVNRPSASFSHSASGQLIGTGGLRGAPISRCCSGGSILGPAPSVPASTAQQCASIPSRALRTLREPRACGEGWPARYGRVRHGRFLQGTRYWHRLILTTLKLSRDLEEAAEDVYGMYVDGRREG